MSATLPPSTLTEEPGPSRGRPRKTAYERDDGNRRQDLLRAAARLFRTQGFAATTTRDIATAAGIDWPTLGAALKREGRLHLETY